MSRASGSSAEHASDIFTAPKEPVEEPNTGVLAPTGHPRAVPGACGNQQPETDGVIPTPFSPRSTRSRATSFASSSEHASEDQIKMILFDDALRAMESGEDELASSSAGEDPIPPTSAQTTSQANVAAVKVPTSSAVHISAPSESPTLQDSANTSASPCVPTSLPPTTSAPSSTPTAASPALVSHSSPSSGLLDTDAAEPIQDDRDPLIPHPLPCAPASSQSTNTVALEVAVSDSSRPKESPHTRSFVKVIDHKTPESVSADEGTLIAMAKRRCALKARQSVLVILNKGERPKLKVEDDTEPPSKNSAAKPLLATEQSPKKRLPRKSEAIVSASVTELTPTKTSTGAAGKTRASPRKVGPHTSVNQAEASPALEVIIPVKFDAPFKAKSLAAELDDGKQNAEGNPSSNSRSSDPEIRKASTAKASKTAKARAALAIARSVRAADAERRRESQKRKDGIVAEDVALKVDETQIASSSAEAQQQKASTSLLSTDRHMCTVVFIKDLSASTIDLEGVDESDQDASVLSSGSIEENDNILKVTDGDQVASQPQLLKHVDPRSVSDGGPAAVDAGSKPAGDGLAPTPSNGLSGASEVTLEANQGEVMVEDQKVEEEIVKGESSSGKSPEDPVPLQPPRLPPPSALVDIPFQPMEDISHLQLDDTTYLPADDTQAQVPQSPSASANVSTLLPSPLTETAPAAPPSRAIDAAPIDVTKSQERDDSTENEELVGGVYLDPFDLATRSLYLSFRTGPDLLQKPAARAAHISDEEIVISPRRKPGRPKKSIDGEEPGGTAKKPVWRSRKKENQRRCSEHNHTRGDFISPIAGQQSKGVSVHKGDGPDNAGRYDPNKKLRRQSRVNYDESQMFDVLLTEVESGNEIEDCGDNGEAEIPRTQRSGGCYNRSRANPFIDDEAVESGGEGNSWEDRMLEGLLPPRKRSRRQEPAKAPRATSAMRNEEKAARERETLSVCCRMNGDPPSTSVQRYREPSLEPFMLDDDEPDVEYAEEIPLTFPQARQNRIVLARRTVSPPPALSQPRASLHRQLPRPSPSPSQPVRKFKASQPFPSYSRPSVPSSPHREILSDLQAIDTALSELSTSYSQIVQNLASLGSNTTSTLRSHGEWMNHYGQFLAQHATWENFATSQLVRPPSLSQFASRGSSSSSSTPLEQKILEDLQEMKRGFDRASTSFHRVVRNLARMGHTSQCNGEWMSAFGQFLTYHGKWERSVAAALDGDDEEEVLVVRQGHSRMYSQKARMKVGK
ncbi:uncharacterized protein UTRI_05551_B [Ustilago trichophora]|uniref:Uncharacterized protein n=1 Tax=Ustilago trichophora TaxID=86804 RepID=A0A5C3EM50_9BASI|nr:uncharacterized protein UTRI_05551_B [Ustilago trichophora]